MSEWTSLLTLNNVSKKHSLQFRMVFLWFIYKTELCPIGCYHQNKKKRKPEFLKVNKKLLKNSEIVKKNYMWLPSGLNLQKKDLNYICKKINNFYSS